jgi:hypothetical protein
MEKLALVARLKEGSEPKAAELLAKGAPFDPAEHGLERHTVYLSAAEVVFVFEGHEVERLVDELIDDPFQWKLLTAFDAWRELVDGPPHIARTAYSWERATTN